MLRSLISRPFISAGSCAAALLAVTHARAVTGQATFHGLGDLPGGTAFSMAIAVSGDGRIVVGQSNSGNGNEAARWQLNPDGSVGSPQGLGDLTGGSFGSRAAAASFDGSVVVGFSNSINGNEAFRWTATGGMVGLGDLPGEPFLSGAGGVSADGSVVVGGGLMPQTTDGTCEPIPGSWQQRAFRWTASSGMVGLELLPALNRPQSLASCVSQDGSVIGGVVVGDPGCNGQVHGPPVRWVNTSISIVGSGEGQITDCSPEGTAFVGSSLTGTNGFLWTSTGGLVAIGSTAQPAGVSSNAQTVVGMTLQGTSKAFIWTSTSGLRILRDVLISDHGLTQLAGWSLTSATGVSDDGRTIVGNGVNPSGQTEGWVVQFLPDTDGDGLLDDWELNGGVPYIDAFGAAQRYELDFDGNTGPDCSVNRKDIFVEVDAMVGMAPNPAAYLAVKAAFDAAPISNPNGAASGIKLHVIEDELDIPVGDWTRDDTNANGTADWPTEFDALKLTAVSNPQTLINGYFGTSAERDADNSAVTAAALREAKAKAFRYCIFGRSMDATVTPPTTGPGGIAEIGGNDFAITMGLWANLFLEQQSGMFMHELGHTLGLRHGGGDDINYKPNYYSVMNYSYTTPQQWMTTWPLQSGRGGFSRFALPTLNENALNECAAQVTPGSVLAGTIFVSSYVDGSLVHNWSGRYDVAPDWNNSQPPCEDPVAVDINRLPIEAGHPAPPASPGESLIGHDDWAAVVLNFRDHPSFAAGVHNAGAGEAGMVEMTHEENQAIANMLPPFCLGDIDDSRSVNVIDLLAVINAWGACPNGCLADIAPLPADSQVNVIDLLAVINHWGACPRE